LRAGATIAAMRAVLPGVPSGFVTVIQFMNTTFRLASFDGPAVIGAGSQHSGKNFCTAAEEAFNASTVRTSP
jgi:protein involved in ribonucleotide reduction